MKTLKNYKENEIFDVYYALRNACNALECDIKEWEKLNEEFACKSIIDKKKEELKNLEELKNIFAEANKLKIVGK